VELRILPPFVNLIFYEKKNKLHKIAFHYEQNNCLELNFLHYNTFKTLFKMIYHMTKFIISSRKSATQFHHLWKYKSYMPGKISKYPRIESNHPCTGKKSYLSLKNIKCSRMKAIIFSGEEMIFYGDN